MAKYHMLKIPDGLWGRLWEIARKRKEPTQPSQVAREILEKAVKKPTSQKPTDRRAQKPAKTR